ncbi:MAG: lipopolysaccharide heptosyltransferase II [Deltaproteobacteria bacterium]|nr:lipopolysaccharide heptosyltransferase II [Deltaproteobacteria bacterium]
MPFIGFWKKKNTPKITKPNSILIIKLSSIGDVVHALPLLEVLRKNFSKARIDWLVEPDASQIIKGHKDIDHIIVSNRKSWSRQLIHSNGKSSAKKEIVQFIRELRRTNYDWVIDIQGLFKSGILTFLSKGKRKVGLSTSREFSSIFLTEQPCPVDIDQHALERYLAIAKHLRCDNAEWKGEIPIDTNANERIDTFIKNKGLQGKKVIAINPMARWNTKLWDPEKFALLADRIKKGWASEVIFTGSVKDRSDIKRILNTMTERAIDLTGETTLKELACLYAKCDLLITTDSGPMHMAAAMGCPTVALFGPTAPWRTGPYGKGHVVIRDEIKCSPCFKKKCDHMTCMKNITVDRVYNGVEAILKK